MTSDTLSKEQMKELRKEAKLEMARRNFWHYCKLMASNFYKEERTFLREMANSIQDFIENDKKEILVLNVPPRHGKSHTATRLVQWLFGHSNEYKVMTASYNELLSTEFSSSVRDVISETKEDEDRIVYSDIFPNTNIKYGDASKGRWSLEGSPVKNYLATSPKGSATGFGANIIIVDDLIKNHLEGNDSRILEEHWNWFTGTMLSRREKFKGKNGKIIIIMTRWNVNDLAGRVLETFDKDTIQHISFPAMNEKGEMLCGSVFDENGNEVVEGILNKEDFEMLMKTSAPHIWKANYLQEPYDVVGKLYTKWQTYENIPEEEIVGTYAYVDTADTGNDYLSMFIYELSRKGKVYIKDYVYTQDDMSITEGLVAKKLTEHNVNEAVIESNNGGRGFARMVERIIRNQHNNHTTIITTFHQSRNKESRILTHATWIMNNVYFPNGWENNWSDVFVALDSYQSKGRNKHDDAPDSLTGVAERSIRMLENGFAEETDVDETLDMLGQFGF